MTLERLPSDVIEQDHTLEKSAEGAARDLILLRWHWTLDESNPDRVSIEEYARQVGRSQPGIWRDAQAGVLLDNGAVIQPNEARERATMGAETQEAVAAVASAHGVSFGQARKEYRNEARAIRETARQRAEEKGTTTFDELPKVAAMHGRMVAADRTSREERRKNRTMRFIRMEAKLIKARRQLLGALQESDGVEFDAEERELLQDTITNVKKLLNLLDRAIADRYDQSWKSELRVLEGGLAS